MLTRLLSLPDAESPVLVPASILIGSWKGKYKALVDGASTDRIHGSADKVTSREQEDASLTYDMENYEVIRCRITMSSQMVQGLTFRFADMVDSATLDWVTKTHLGPRFNWERHFN